MSWCNDITKKKGDDPSIMGIKSLCCLVALFILFVVIAVVMSKNRYCANPRQLLQDDGSCLECPPYQRRVEAEDGDICDSHQCHSLQRLLETGLCQDCQMFERSQGGGKLCGPDPCTSTYKLIKDGTCEKCPEFSKA